MLVPYPHPVWVARKAARTLSRHRLPSDYPHAESGTSLHSASSPWPSFEPIGPLIFHSQAGEWQAQQAARRTRPQMVSGGGASCVEISRVAIGWPALRLRIPMQSKSISSIVLLLALTGVFPTHMSDDFTNRATHRRRKPAGRWDHEMPGVCLPRAGRGGAETRDEGLGGSAAAAGGLSLDHHACRRMR